MKRYLFVIALAILYFVNTNFAQQTSPEKLFEIKGFVKNQDKISLAGIGLFFEGNATGKFITSDENGAFVAKLPVGKYKITVNETISKNFVAFIEIFNSNLNPTDFELIMEMDKECCGKMSNGNPTEVIKYFAPKFPAAAIAVRAFGEVVVSIRIDKEGNVISAKVESGHPLLRQAAEQAVKQWLFSVDENAAEREGKIIVVFIGETKAEKQTDLFIKPNRLEVFASSPIINY